MKIIGITGLSGSGKSTITNMLNCDNRYEVVNIDNLVHYLLETESVKNHIVKLFGTDILKENKIQRKLLGQKVFSSKEMLNMYNDTIYEYMKQEIDDIIKKSKKDIILDWPLLPITEYFDKCDFTILVKSTAQLRQQRVSARDNITVDYHKKRDIDESTFENKKYTFTIINDSDLDNLNKQVDLIKNKMEM